MSPRHPFIRALQEIPVASAVTVSSIISVEGDRPVDQGITDFLSVALGADLQAGVPFYGAAAETADVPRIKAPLLIHHAETDERLDAMWPADLSHVVGGVPDRRPASSRRSRRLTTPACPPSWAGSRRPLGTPRPPCGSRRGEMNGASSGARPRTAS